jgi:predicted RNase H-like HicB family nuclease
MQDCSNKGCLAILHTQLKITQALMLTFFINAALSRAHYEILADDGSVYAEIPELPGVWANAASVEKCRHELQETLEEWMLRQLQTGKDLPKFSLSRKNHSSLVAA